MIFDEFPHSIGTATSMKTALADYGLPNENITIIAPDNYEMLPYEKLTEKDRSRPKWATGKKVKEKDVHFTGTTIRGNSGQILEYIHGAKIVGREIGQELHTELERQKSLEQKVSSVVAVGGFLGSLFFLSSNLTGNAIANLNVQNSSFLGAGLLVVGLVAGWFWLKGKK